MSYMLSPFIYSCCLQTFVNSDLSGKTLSYKVTSKFIIMNFDLQPICSNLRKLCENELNKKQYYLLYNS